MKRKRDKFTHPSEVQEIGAHEYPYKFREEMIDETRRLARFGLTDAEIAEWFKISVQTYDAYKRDIPEFYRALQDGRMYDSMKVVDSLHKQALGYIVQEHEVAEHCMRNGEVIELKKTITKFVNPSVTAAIYLLKTRHGDKWMDIIKTEKTQNLNILVKNVDFSDMTDEELLTLKKIGIKRIPNEFNMNHTKALPEKGMIRNKTIQIQDVQGN
ncbi:MAG: hypothetical protein WC827_04015 [Candidatus Paceibacterota bacterium]|jgi:hypothetical protein